MVKRPVVDVVRARTNAPANAQHQEGQPEALVPAVDDDPIHEDA
jgi:hypothetical protein